MFFTGSHFHHQQCPWQKQKATTKPDQTLRTWTCDLKLSNMYILKAPLFQRSVEGDSSVQLGSPLHAGYYVCNFVNRIWHAKIHFLNRICKSLQILRPHWKLGSYCSNHGQPKASPIILNSARLCAQNRGARCGVLFKRRDSLNSSVFWNGSWELAVLLHNELMRYIVMYSAYISKKPVKNTSVWPSVPRGGRQSLKAWYAHWLVHM